MSEDGEVDPEEEEVEDQRNNDETNHPGEEVFGNAFLLVCQEEWPFVGMELLHCRISSSPIDPKGRQ